jgi:uncharacterized protein RhaS with RHS repeats
MYDPTVGRFLQEDPTGFTAGDANPNRYCGNSPTNVTDPTGTFWDWVWGGIQGTGQGVLNIANGLQDTAIGIANLPATAVNGIAWAEEKAGVLDPNAPLRAPKIPSPDWSRGVITQEGGQGWGDTHNWSKAAGATGVSAAVAAWARAAQLEKAGEAAKAAQAAFEEWVDEFGARGAREAGRFPTPEEYFPGEEPPSGYDGWLGPEDQYPGD